MYSVIDYSDQYSRTLWAVLVFCFRTLLRKSNVVPDSSSKMLHVVRRCDIEFCDWGMWVRVKSSKTLQFAEYVLEIPVHYVQDLSFCVVSMLKRHFTEMPAAGDSPLFLKPGASGNVPVLYNDLLRFIKLLSGRIGMDPSEYGSHSLRRAGALFLHELQVPLSDIMCLGDWASMSVLDYLVTPSDRKHKIQDQVAKAFKNSD